MNNQSNNQSENNRNSGFNGRISSLCMTDLTTGKTTSGPKLSLKNLRGNKATEYCQIINLVSSSLLHGNQKLTSYP